MDQPILSVSHVFKSFGVVKALRDVSFSIGAGEIHGLIGENGSGKSTVSHAIAGILPIDKGEILLKGAPYDRQTAVEASAAGVSMVVQEMGTIPGISVAANLFLGHEEKFSTAGFMNLKKMNREAQELLARVGITNVNAADPIDIYSFEERKLIEIARAVYNDPVLLIIDETTTALSLTGREILYSLMRRLANEGKSVLFISHDLDELMSICSILTVLRDGVIIDTIDKEHFEAGDIKAKMVGRKIEGDYYRPDYDCTYEPEVLLKMEHVCTDTVHDICFELHKGEILGFSGLSESGIHDIGRLAYGIERPIYGRVTLPQKGEQIHKPLHSMHNRLGYVSKDRDKESLILNDTIKNNISINAYDLMKTGPAISRRKETRYVQEQIDYLRIKCSSMEQMVRTLSGGNKQKVAFGRWMGVDSQILILDCPTRGVDIGVKTAMYQLMTRLKKEGKALLVISEEMTELIGMCDRILVIKDGEITKEFTRRADLTEQKIIEYMI